MASASAASACLHLGVERLRLRVVGDRVDHLTAAGLERRREVLGEAVAVVVVEVEDHERGVAVLGDDLGQHLALQDVGRAEAEVEALVGVVRELLRRVGRARTA